MQQRCINRDEIYEKIKKEGGRLTKTKKAIIDILFSADCFISRKMLVKKLKDKKIKPDRSTLYRDLKNLLAIGVLKQNYLSGESYYELLNKHHHHFICTNCFSFYNFYNFSSKNCITEKKYFKGNNFEILNHSFDFYGRCLNCLNKK